MNNHYPQSASYPNLIVTQRNFNTNPELLPGRVCPYPAVSGKTVYYEFRGRGIPPEDVGQPGDVYWDVTFPYILYTCNTAHAWTVWNPYASSGAHLLAKNPIYRDRYLWVTGAKVEDALSWFSSGALKSTDYGAGTGHSLDDKPQQQLLLALHFSPATKQKLALDIGDNQRRHDAEVQRRLLNGVAVGDTLNAQEAVPALIGEPGPSETEEKLRAENDTLKRKRQEQAEVNEHLVESKAQAEARIKELTKAREDVVRDAENRERDLARRLKKAEDTNKVLEDELSRREAERKAGLWKLAKAISVEIERA